MSKVQQRVDEIERMICSGDMNAHQVFTQMLQLIPGDVWRKFPDDPPAALPWGQYENYLVATKNESGKTQVFECSWMGQKWHRRFDGCSEVNHVKWWCEKPAFPAEQATDGPVVDLREG